MTTLLRWLGCPQSDDVRRVIGGAWHAGRDVSPAVLWIILALGVAAAAINWLPQVAMRLGVRIQTTLFRLAMTAIVLAVAAGLEWHGTLEMARRPEWTVLVDDSASMGVTDGGENRQSRYAAAVADLQTLQKEIGDRVEWNVETVSGRPFPGAARSDAASGVPEPGAGPTLLRDAIARTALARSAPDRLILLTDGRDSEARDLTRIGEELKARGVAVTVKLYGSEQPPVDAGLSAEPEQTVLRLGEELVVRGTLTGPSRGERTVTVLENGKEMRRLTVSNAPSPPAKNGSLSTPSKTPTAGGEGNSVARPSAPSPLPLSPGAGERGSAGPARFEFRHRPAKAGVHVYRFEGPTGDAAAANNAAAFTVSVVEEKINVLLIEGFPRYEYKLLKGVLEVDPLVNLVGLSHLPGGGVYVQGEPLHKNAEQGLIASAAELFKYDVVILRDVPRSLFRAGGDATESRLRHIVEFVTKRGGGLLVTGGQDVYRAGGYEDSPLVEVLPFDLSDAVSRDPQFEGLFHALVTKTAADHPLLRLVPDADENRQRWNTLRELDGSNNVGRVKPLATPLLHRMVKVKGPAGEPVEKDAPVLAYLAVGDGKVLATSVDTLWRWQLQPDYDDPPLAALLANAVRYLSPPPGRRPGLPSVTAADGTPQVGQNLVLTTELRDPNFDPITNADLVVTVTPPSGAPFRMYPRDLPEEPGIYEYRVPLDQPGTYRVAAQYLKQTQVREFTVGAAAGEFTDLSIDRTGMQRLTKAAGGEVASVPVSQWAAHADTAGSRETVVRELEVWNSPLVLILFLALVSADCFVRKRQGLA